MTDPHNALDAVGMLEIPYISIGADLLNAAWYYAEGQTFLAGVSVVAALPGVGTALAQGAKDAARGVKALDTLATNAKLALGSTRAAGALADGMQAGKKLVSRGLGSAADQALHAGRSIGVRVPATKCDIPIANRVFNWCFTPDTLVIVSGETIDEVRAEDGAPAAEEPNVALAGWLPSADVAAGVCAALAIGAAASGAKHDRDDEPQQLPNRRRRQPAPREYDLLHARLRDEDFAAEDAMDEELLREIALEAALDDSDPCTALRESPGDVTLFDRRSAQIPAHPRPRERCAKASLRYDSPKLRAEQESADRAAIDRFTVARRLRRLSVVAFLLAAVGCWFGAPSLRQGESPSAPLRLASKERASFTPSAAMPSALPAKRIEAIQLGDRVAGTNPLREQAELVEPDEETWREVRLRLKKADGGVLWIDLLRPIEWLDIYEARVGATIYLDLTEMGAEGDAEILDIRPCPKIDAGAGAVVTGKFRHEVTNGEIAELRLDGQVTPTRVTANHPYWSEDRQGFVPAGDLRVGERLDTLAGNSKVASLTRVPYSGALYNLETSEHVYRVGLSGVLVHNSCLVTSRLHSLDLTNKAWRSASFSQDGLVYVLRNQATGELLKVGQTTSRSFLSRFKEYVTAGNRWQMKLSVDVFETPLARRGIIEGEIRRHLALMHRLPWDNTGLRLGRPGPGIP